MFLGFGKRNSTPKKIGTSQESPKTLSSPGLSLNAEGLNGGSRSTIQTTAGPLLSSTRFNSILDASTYANVNSPGFSSRVVNCASNGISSHHENSATHHNKYSSVGLFPRVNLGSQSTLSILSPRNSQKVGKTPVRVRIAPPASNLNRRHSICIDSSGTFNNKSEISKQLLSSHQPSLRKDSSSTSSKETDCGSTPDHLQEASRKRIFSESQDNNDETKKRRKKTEIPIPNPNHDVYHYRHVRAPAVPVSHPHDNSSQGKRAREKGSPEEQKRQRRKVCNTNNAIFSSLSSSRNLLERLTGQKRKSIDTSRSSSPQTPLSGKQVKERKPALDLSSSDSNLSDARQQNAKAVGGTLEGTPISSKVISRRANASGEEKKDSGEKSAPSDSHHNSSCDYTTKLFRKDVSSHVPRTQTFKIPKQSLWVQAPEVDDLSCSLLGDDFKLDRPERLKSLLARVSGKADKSSANETNSMTSEASKEIPKGSGAALPGNTTPKAISPSSAVTVTVSSTCTIMTSATVTSVNGVPSSESNHPPRTLSASVLSTQSAQSSLAIKTSKSTDISSVSLSVGCSAPSVSSIPKPESVCSAAGSVSAITGTTDNGSKPPTSFSVNSPSSSSTISLVDSKANTSVESPRATFQFASSSNNLQTAGSSMYNIGTSLAPAAVSATSITSSTSLSSLSQAPKSDLTATVSSSTFQFSSNQSNCAMLSGTKSSTDPSNLSFGSSSNAQTGASNTGSLFTVNATSSSATSKTLDNAGIPKPNFSFGSSNTVSSETPKAAPNIGTSSNLEVSSKSFQFGQVTNSQAATSFQSGSTITSPATSTFQFGSVSNGPKTGVQFGSTSAQSSEATKSSFQFGSSSSTSSVAPSSSFRFGSNVKETGVLTTVSQFGSNSTSSPVSAKPSFQFGASISSEAPKPTVQFGSSNRGTSDAPKSAFQFGSSNGISSGNSKPAFQFVSSNAAEVSKPALSFGATGNGSAVASSQIKGGSQNSTETNPAFQFGAGNVALPTLNQFGSNSSSQSASSPFQFGLTSGKSVDSTKPAFQFSSSSEKPLGSSIQGAGSAFSQVPQQQSKGGFAFGQSSNPSTNSNEAKSSFSFGSSTPSFGASIAGSAQFGTGSNSSSFGSLSSTQPAPPSFGSPAPKSNGFGSTPSFGSVNSGAFSFSANSVSGAGTSTVAGGAFSFGQNQEQATPSFSFNATVTSIPSQSAQAPGLFSVGAGSSTSTRRVIRDARRRR
ncbi:Nucleoporin NSP1 [Frankliniella fusca]|uniref:Nucleoporin NSP1 n=1 Tax=Frankliniella fusca TaxID=407009 RepID=A0AAE1LCG0_9NEOP|nr:Nucleoporin NSP1 [Frankliniella fusca]